MDLAEHSMQLAEHAITRAGRAFAANIYEDAVRDAYLSAYHAARQILLDKEANAPIMHSAVRKGLAKLMHSDMGIDSRALELLHVGRSTMNRLDFGPEIVFISREQAEDYLNRAAAFLAAAKAACA